MSFNLRWRLTLMMALEYGIWGAWAAVAGQYYTSLGASHGFNGKAIGFIFSLMPLAMILSPFFAGSMADRFFHSEKMLGILQLFGCFLLLFVSQQVNYGSLAILMFVYAIFYAPTVALTNTIAFRHLTNPTRYFSSIRVGGTVGWLLGGWLLGLWRYTVHIPIKGDLFFIAALLSLFMGIYSFTLPATPPAGKRSNPLAFMDALRLFKNRNFLVFMIITFLSSTQLDFYYIFSSAYLAAPIKAHGMGFSSSALPFILSIAQVSEFVVMLSLPWILPRIGLKTGLTLGLIAWAGRFLIFSLAPIRALVLAALCLHGFCIVFFFVIGFMYVNEIAPLEIQASAQSLVTLALFGLGRYCGSFLAGYVRDMFTAHIPGQGDVTNWHIVFLIPAILTICCAILFPIFFHESGETMGKQTLQEVSS
jgi:nucleoside transporter